MLIHDLLSPERISFDVHAGSKKRLLEIISDELAANSDQLSQREIFESLIARERLGSTGLGSGVAIPHGRVKGTQGVEAAFSNCPNRFPSRRPTDSPSTSCLPWPFRKTAERTT